MALSTEKKVGLFFLVTIFALAVVIELVEDWRPFETRSKYVAFFDAAVGISAGDSVRLAGVEVGKIEAIGIEDNKVRIKFKHTAGGLAAHGDKPLSHFTIAGEDQKFVPATATIDGETLVVSSPDVAKPVAVRFGWEDTAEPNLFNKAGLPASPFRTGSGK